MEEKSMVTVQNIKQGKRLSTFFNRHKSQIGKIHRC